MAQIIRNMGHLFEVKNVEIIFYAHSSNTLICFV